MGKRVDDFLEKAGYSGDFVDCVVDLIKLAEDIEKDLTAVTEPINTFSDEEACRNMAQRMVSYWHGPSKMLVAFLRLLVRTTKPSWRPIKDKPLKAGWYAILDADNEPRVGLWKDDYWLHQSVEPLKAWCEFPSHMESK